MKLLSSLSNLGLPLGLFVILSAISVRVPEAYSQSIAQVRGSVQALSKQADKQQAAAVKINAEQSEEEKKAARELVAEEKRHREGMEALKKLRLLFVESKDEIPETKGKSYEEAERLKKKWAREVMTLPDSILELNIPIVIRAFDHKYIGGGKKEKERLKKLGLEISDDGEYVRGSTNHEKASAPIAKRPSTVEDTKWLIDRTPSLEVCQLISAKHQKSIDNYKVTHRDQFDKYQKAIAPLIAAGIKINVFSKEDAKELALTQEDSGHYAAVTLLNKIEELEKQRSTSAELKDLLVKMSLAKAIVRKQIQYESGLSDLRGKLFAVSNCNSAIKDRNLALDATIKEPSDQNFTVLYEKSAKAYQTTTNNRNDLTTHK